MSRTLLLAATLAASTASSAIADEEFISRWKWDGAMRIVNASPQCEGKVVSDENAQVRLYPQMDPDLERTSFTRFSPFETEMVKRTTDGQFNGGGQYYALRTAHGRVQVYYGAWNFVQTPTVITNTTIFVTLVGQLHDYNDIDGCTVGLRGTFVRALEPDQEPAPGD